MSGSGKKRIFISYRRTDRPDTVKLIDERLRKELPRWEIFYDHKSIPPGEAFPERLRREVMSADVVLVIIGPNWLTSLLERKLLANVDHVREEVRLALESGHTVIPVPVANALNLAEVELSEFTDIQGLANLNSRPIRPEPDFDNDLQRLVSYLELIGPDDGAGTILVAKYKLVRVLGEGGMGIVWLAEQLNPRRSVAIKLIRPGMDSREILARFDAERQALGVMDHPNIAKVYDAGQAANGRPFFVMQFVHGRPITEYCNARKLSPQARLLLFQQACDAVQHAHQKGIIHRDIKPGNVLVEEVQGKPVVKVIDFGLAKALGHKLTNLSLHTAFDARVGTLEYSSPEQSAGGSTDVDTRTDIYSLGALLYELLTGEPPFSRAELVRAGDVEMRRVIQEQDPLRPSVKLSSSNALPSIAIDRHLEPHKLTALLRGDLDWIVMKALEKDRSRRYPSANGLAEEIQRYLVGDPIQARPPSTSYRVRKYVSKHRGFVASVAAMTTLLVLGIIGTGWFGIRANAAKKDALIQKSLADENYKIANEAKRRVTEEQLKTLIALDKSEANLARSNYFLANARWNENRVSDALSTLQRIPEKHRDFGWHLDRRLYQGSDLTLYGHQEFINQISFSPDGTRLASCADDHSIKIWDAQTGAEIHWLKGHQDRVSQLCFSPDGNSLATGSDDRSIKIWDTRTGIEIRTLAWIDRETAEDDAWSDDNSCLAFNPAGTQLASSYGDEKIRIWDTLTGVESQVIEVPGDSISCLKFSPDGNRLASGTWEFTKLSFLGTIQLWDVKSGAGIGQFNEQVGGVTDLAFSPDGRHLVSSGTSGGDFLNRSSSSSSSANGECILWDVQNLTKVRVFTGHQDLVHSVVFSPDGARFASGSADALIKVWDIRSGLEIFSLVGHRDMVSCLAFSPDGSRLASGSWDNTIKVWDAKTGSAVRTLTGHQDGVCTVRFSPDGSRFASGAKDDSIKIWEVHSATEMNTLRGHEKEVLNVSFSSDGCCLDSVSSDGIVKNWDVRSGTAIRTLSCDDDYMQHTAFSPDGTSLASSSFGDKTIKLWKTQTAAEIGSLNGLEEAVTCVTFSPDGKCLAYGLWDHTITLWNVPEGIEIRRLRGGHIRPVSCVAFSADGTRLASASQDGTIKLWDVLTGVEIRTLHGHQAPVNSISFSRDGTNLVSGSGDYTIKLWDVQSGTELRTLAGHKDSVEALSFSPDGTCLASGSLDNTVKLWDARPGAESRELFGHQERISALSFSPDGTRFGSGSWDKTIKLWDTQTGVEIHTLSGHLDAVNSIAFSSDGKCLASASSDATIKLWDTLTGAEIRSLRGHDQTVLAVAFSPDGSRLYSQGVDDEKFVWDCASGNQVTTEEWTAGIEPTYVSSNRRWLIMPFEASVVLVDLAFKNNPIEQAYRRSKATFDREWHRQQAELCDDSDDDYAYAALIHRAWVMKADPENGLAYDELRTAYQAWRDAWESTADDLPELADPQESIRVNAAADSANKTTRTAPDPDLLLQPIVREMLTLPRGQDE